MNKKSKNNKKNYFFSKGGILYIFILLIIGLLLGFLWNERGVGNIGNGQEAKSVRQVEYSEIKQILALQKTKDQEPHLLKLLERIGPEKTQEELVRSGLPFTGETHLLVHTIGEHIYKKYGPSGLKMCKDYFLSACFHAFIIEDLSENGVNGLSKSMGSCKDVGQHVLAQCSHASGHGFVVWNGYDLVKALKMCDELASKPGNTPAFNCYDGVFMENIFSVHEGKLSEKRWVSDTDQYYPCNDPRIPEKYWGGCWTNQASLMYIMHKGDFKRVAEGCDGVENERHQELCYNNFARQIHPVTRGQFDKAITLCKNATGEKWQNYCLHTLMKSSFSVGDRGKLPFEICHSMNTAAEKNSCYDDLYRMIGWYVKDHKTAVALCKNVLDKSYIKKCEEYLAGKKRNLES